ncbi:MAG: hypothetical protein MSA33_06615 [Campylobacter sp.]|uniref:hypothetical protein n=1 Tax=Campylobacter sp. TaxID=205 RepID=UPI002AA87CDA|nr:hypothetical protein [Campylobacter sp.]MCI7550096.1 hypothetical protein [Campylobacter sp.]
MNSYSESCINEGLNFLCMTDSDFTFSMSIAGILVGFCFMIISFLIVSNIKA